MICEFDGAETTGLSIARHRHRSHQRFLTLAKKNNLTLLCVGAERARRISSRRTLSERESKRYTRIVSALI